MRSVAVPALMGFIVCGERGQEEVGGNQAKGRKTPTLMRAKQRGGAFGSVLGVEMDVTLSRVGAT